MEAQRLSQRRVVPSSRVSIAPIRSHSIHTEWLFQPYEIGCVLLRHPELLRRTFGLTPEYLEDANGAEGEVNLFEEGVQLTRSFRALKLWLSFKVFGVAALRAAVERGIRLAELAERTLREDSCWEVVSPAQLGGRGTFRYAARELSPARLDRVNQDLVAASVRGGFAFVSSTVLKGRTALRMCTINPRTTDEDVRATIRQLESYARNL